MQLTIDNTLNTMAKTIKLLDHTTVERELYINSMYDDTFYYEHLGMDKVLSYSSLKYLLKSPKWFAHKLKKQDDKETQALRDGKLIHTQILEPNKYDQFTFVDTSSKNTTKWKLAKEQNGASNTYTKKEQYMCNRISSAFLQNAKCVSFMKGAENEIPMLKEVLGIPVRAKADILKEGEYVADVKTTIDDLKDVVVDGKMSNSFADTIDAYDYDLQAYLYTQMFNVPDFYWLVINKFTTDIGVFKASAKTLQRGKDKLEAAVALYNAFFVDELVDLSQYQKELTL